MFFPGRRGDYRSAGIRRRSADSAIYLSLIHIYVWKEKNMYGKKTMGVVRTTYLIDEEGVIEKVFGKVKAAENPRQMLNLL